MKYYYEAPEDWSHHGWKIYSCDHPLYNRCTLYLRGERGLAVIQIRFDQKNKSIWWGSLDPPLAFDIQRQEKFEDYFEQHATLKDEYGLYFTVPVRKLMWALRMKPLPKAFWETESFQNDEY